MNCVEAEQLFDAYLDNELSGSLRLEFDAHRLRCPQCQRKLALLEACEQVLAAERTPALSDDFTDRVMARILERQNAPATRVSRRLYIGAASGIGIAAALTMAVIYWPSVGPTTLPGGANSGTHVANATVEKSSAEIDQAIREKDYAALLSIVNAKVDTMSAAGRNLAHDARQLPGLAIHMALAGEMTEITPLNPLSWILGVGDTDVADEPDASGEQGHFSL